MTNIIVKRQFSIANITNRSFLICRSSGFRERNRSLVKSRNRPVINITIADVRFKLSMCAMRSFLTAVYAGICMRLVW